MQQKCDNNINDNIDRNADKNVNDIASSNLHKVIDIDLILSKISNICVNTLSHIENLSDEIFSHNSGHNKNIRQDNVHSNVDHSLESNFNSNNNENANQSRRLYYNSAENNIDKDLIVKFQFLFGRNSNLINISNTILSLALKVRDMQIKENKEKLREFQLQNKTEEISDKDFEILKYIVDNFDQKEINKMKVKSDEEGRLTKIREKVIIDKKEVYKALNGDANRLESCSDSNLSSNNQSIEQSVTRPAAELVLSTSLSANSSNLNAKHHIKTSERCIENPPLLTKNGANTMASPKLMREIFNIITENEESVINRKKNDKKNRKISKNKLNSEINDKNNQDCHSNLEKTELNTHKTRFSDSYILRMNSEDTS